MIHKSIIGLAGKLACGKGTFAQYLIKKYKAVKLGFSDPLRETLNIFDVEETRHNLQLLSTLLRQNFSEDILAKALYKRSQKIQAPFIIIDGVRRKTDIEIFNNSKNFLLIYIEADDTIRYKRYVIRNQYPGDDTMTYEKFLEKDNAESELQITTLKPSSNFVIINEGSLEAFNKKIDETLQYASQGKN